MGGNDREATSDVIPDGSPAIFAGGVISYGDWLAQGFRLLVGGHIQQEAVHPSRGDWGPLDSCAGGPFSRSGDPCFVSRMRFLSGIAGFEKPSLFFEFELDSFTVTYDAASFSWARSWPRLLKG